MNPYLVPKGTALEWHSFYAKDGYDLVWSSGLVGARAAQRQATPDERTDLIQRIDQAAEKLQDYLDELQLARRVLLHTGK